MWQNQAHLNIIFSNTFDIGFSFIKDEIAYNISGIGYTHVLCTRENYIGEDLFISKEDLLKNINGRVYESKKRVC